MLYEIDYINQGKIFIEIKKNNIISENYIILN